jgi:hypothetical protein
MIHQEATRIDGLDPAALPTSHLLSKCKFGTFIVRRNGLNPHRTWMKMILYQGQKWVKAILWWAGVIAEIGVRAR